MYKIIFNLPKVEGNRIYFSWEPNYIFKNNSYYVEYCDLKMIETTPQALAEACLPLCLVFSLLGKVEIHLPHSIPESILNSWYKICQDTARKLYKYPLKLKIVSPPGFVPYKPLTGDKTALLFGGGSESLLTLARLNDKGISPLLVSMWGSNWAGSNFEINKVRLQIENEVSKSFNLNFFRIYTNFRDLIIRKNCSPYLKQNFYIINSVLFLPLNLSFIIPVAEQINLKSVISGNEKESSSDPGFYTLSSEMTKNLANHSSFFNYFSDLENIPKVDVVRILHNQYASYARYQYSCWLNQNERWCLACEKCLRNYVIFKIFNTDLKVLGIDEAKIRSNLDKILWELGWEFVSSKAVRAEWEQIFSYAKVHGNSFVLGLERKIRQKYLLRKIYWLIFKKIAQFK